MAKEKEHIGSVAMGDTEAALEKALDAYWNVAYQQGQETRGHDDEHGTAQKAEDALRAAIAALSARPVQEPVASFLPAEDGEYNGNTHDEINGSSLLRRVVEMLDDLSPDETIGYSNGVGWIEVATVEEIRSASAAPQPAHGTSATEREGWVKGIDTAPYADTVLATYFDNKDGEWIVELFVAVRPTSPFTHWMQVTRPDEHTSVPVTAGQGVEVKPLEWRRGYCDDQVTISTAYTIGGLLQIRVLNDVVWLDEPGVGKPGIETIYPSVQAAKAAAQATHERHILSALSSPTPKEESK